MPKRKVLHHGNRKEDVYPLSNKASKQIPEGIKASLLQSPHESLISYNQIKRGVRSTNSNEKQTGLLNAVSGSQRHIMKCTLGNKLNQKRKREVTRLANKNAGNNK